MTTSGTRLARLAKIQVYPDGRPSARCRLQAEDHGIVFRHGSGPRGCDSLGARDVWVWEYSGKFFMHYDGAGSRGWLACLATGSSLLDWSARGPALEFGATGTNDAASASYGVTFVEDGTWHMFYMGTPNTSPPPDLVPAFPYLTMKAEASSPAGPWQKQYEITPFTTKEGTYYSATASPGHVLKIGQEYLMFFSASTARPILRTLGIARTRDLRKPWAIDPRPILPQTEQVENTSLYFQESTRTWFLFTNHVGLRDGLEYTDAIWVYWTNDLESWDSARKAVVLDGSSCRWSKVIIGLPSVVRVGDRLALFYDGFAGKGLPPGAASHMRRDIGLAWLDLPLRVDDF